MVYMIYNKAPFALLTKAGSRIKSLKDLEGTKLAAPAGGATFKLLPLLAKKNGIDYGKLAKWCKQRHGYVQVCESTEANWLQFEPFTLVNTGACGRRKRGFHVEAIHEFENAPTMVHHAIRQGTTLPPHARQKA